MMTGWNRVEKRWKTSDVSTNPSAAAFICLGKSDTDEGTSLEKKRGRTTRVRQAHYDNDCHLKPKYLMLPI